MVPKVKICGITSIEDALFVADMGAHAIGFIFYKFSKRYVQPEKARGIVKKLPVFVSKVGVFVDNPFEEIMEIKRFVMLDRIQVYDEGLLERLDPNITIMGYRIKDEKDIMRAKRSRAFPLLDAFHESLYGGIGLSFDWALIKDFGRPFILAGGINPENIKSALSLKPYALDIASGCESAPGIKDPKKVAQVFNILNEKGF